MGSVVISDVVADFAHYPHTMVVGDVHQVPLTGPEKIQYPPGHNSQTILPSHSQQRYSSGSLTPTRASTSGSSSGSSRPTSQNHQVDFLSPASDGVSSQSCIGEARTGEAVESRQQGHTNAPIHTSEHGHDQSGFPLTNAPQDLTTSPPSLRLLPTLRSSLSLNESVSGSPGRIKVRDLNHIQSFASEEVLTRSRQGSRLSLRKREEGGQKYEISAMPVTDIIEMVSGLLTKITTTNDRQHEHMPRHLPPEGATGLSQQTTSVLAFHGKNVPSITILSYLSRIHKYCPTTYEVFLSLLVYFDRMTEMINSGTLRSFRHNQDPFETLHRLANSSGFPTVGAPNVSHRELSLTDLSVCTNSFGATGTSISTRTYV